MASFRGHVRVYYAKFRSFLLVCQRYNILWVFEFYSRWKKMKIARLENFVVGEWYKKTFWSLCMIHACVFYGWKKCFFQFTFYKLFFLFFLLLFCLFSSNFFYFLFSLYFWAINFNLVFYLESPFFFFFLQKN